MLGVDCLFVGDFGVTLYRHGGAKPTNPHTELLFWQNGKRRGTKLLTTKNTLKYICVFKEED